MLFLTLFSLAIFRLLFTTGSWNCCLYFLFFLPLDGLTSYLCSPLSDIGIQGMFWPLNATRDRVFPCLSVVCVSVCVCVSTFKINGIRCHNTMNHFFCSTGVILRNT